VIDPAHQIDIGIDFTRELSQQIVDGFGWHLSFLKASVAIQALLQSLHASLVGFANCQSFCEFHLTPVRVYTHARGWFGNGGCRRAVGWRAEIIHPRLHAQMYDDLLQLLLPLDGIRQNGRVHPEGDALFHSLQVFEFARGSSSDRVLWAAALLHDVGKVLGSNAHAEVGADLLDGLLAPRVVWLVRHHLDLLLAPQATKRRLRRTSSLTDLQHLRSWDLAGRSPSATVPEPDAALALLLEGDGARIIGPTVRLDWDFDCDGDGLNACASNAASHAHGNSKEAR
jgi:hypothetical protein